MAPNLIARTFLMNLVQLTSVNQSNIPSDVLVIGCWIGLNTFKIKKIILDDKKIMLDES